MMVSSLNFGASLIATAKACDGSKLGLIFSFFAMSAANEKERDCNSVSKYSASNAGATYRVVTTANLVSVFRSTLSTLLARSTNPFSMVRNNVKNSVIDDRNRAPRIRSAT